MPKLVFNFNTRPCIGTRTLYALTDWILKTTPWIKNTLLPFLGLKINEAQKGWRLYMESGSEFRQAWLQRLHSETCLCCLHSPRCNLHNGVVWNINQIHGILEHHYYRTKKLKIKDKMAASIAPKFLAISATKDLLQSCSSLCSSIPHFAVSILRPPFPFSLCLESFKAKQFHPSWVFDRQKTTLNSCYSFEERPFLLLLQSSLALEIHNY